MFLTMFWSTVNQRAQNTRTFFTLRAFDEPYQQRKCNGDVFANMDLVKLNAT